MKKSIIIIVIIAVILAIVLSIKLTYKNDIRLYNKIGSGEVDEGEYLGKMKVSSTFSHNEMIPARYTADGDNINPSLDIEGIPEGTVSLVLIMDDPDAPVGTWDHWIVFNIPVIGKIEEDSVPSGAVQGKNSWGRSDYGGPSPPSGTHRYFFKLYAIDKELELSEGASKSDVLDAIEGYILDQTELIGLYSRG